MSRTAASVFGLAVMAGFLGGCSGGGRPPPFNFHSKTSSEWLDQALEGRTPDERRRGVNELADSRDGRADWAIKAFDSVARTDPDPMVRCAALRALVPVAGAAVVPTALKVLDSETGHATDVKPAPAVVRWDAAKLLLRAVEGASYEQEQRAEIVRILLDRVKNDSDRNVRLTAIDTLAWFPEPAVPPALVEALDTDDFALQHAAEQSLITLTGATNRHDPDAWRAWLAAHPDPFENAGKTPPELRETRKPWWRP